MQHLERLRALVYEGCFAEAMGLVKDAVSLTYVLGHQGLAPWATSGYGDGNLRGWPTGEGLGDNLGGKSPLQGWGGGDGDGAFTRLGVHNRDGSGDGVGLMFGTLRDYSPDDYDGSMSGVGEAYTDRGWHL